MFARGPIPGFRLLLVVVLSLVLVVLDSRFGRVDELRSWLSSALTPVVWLGHVPDSLSEWGANLFTSRDELIEENESLRARLLVLERRSIKYASLAADNIELRSLNGVATQLDETVVVADVIGVSPDPFSHEVIINKGSRDGVTEGQAILDAHGLMGQVVQTSRFTSRVLLISDSSHAVPVEVLRSGVRAILLGTGDPDTLDLVHVPDTADIREGDELVSSGLGGRFPKGYPVAKVTRIYSEPGEPFANIQAEPEAKLNQSDLVLVVFQPQVRAGEDGCPPGEVDCTQATTGAGTGNAADSEGSE
ncbi:rod shape-determining protein MreC [Marinobacter halodurans]|uniref:Cell shape-determining protein MreC n=1 Tax=Marinobacter halodurans TaxID=2528979 RepID=A0ABY1ZNT6_9GAMM|nr:rod shape-determining protein MreC [Marinobacter halodurans]TBW56822.1 rod shape-determining protein MreC [Marinobacter halodurans]